MAYLDLQHDLLFATPAQRQVADRPIQPLLSRAERDVLTLSRRDSLSSLKASTPLRRFGAYVFGLRGPNALANPRLEALRRYVVLLRHRCDRMAKREIGRLIGESFTPVQLAEVRRLIALEMARARSTRQRRQWTAAALVAALALQVLLYRFLTAYLNDGLLGVIFTLLASVTAAPLAGFVQRAISGERAAPAWSR